MKLHIWGCLSGTEPMPGKHHTAWALEKEGALYWFDAGENCARAAHLQGYDVRKIKKLFISHSHADHVGGLYHLLWTMKKLNSLETAPGVTELEILAPEPELVELVRRQLAFDSVMTTLKLDVKSLEEGVVCDDGSVRVECVRNHHISSDASGRLRSFSFRIRAENKTVIFSGDVRCSADMDSFLREGCDLLLMETGHHSAPKLCQEWREKNYAVGDVVFLHHGREILRDEQGVLARCREIRGDSVRIAYDGMELEL